MGLDGDATSNDILRAAVLFSQLPSDSRVIRFDFPDAEWNVEAQFLRLIEYDIRCLAYSLGGQKGAKPKMVELPSERAGHSEIIDESLRAQNEINEILKDVL